MIASAFTAGIVLTALTRILLAAGAEHLTGKLGDLLAVDNHGSAVELSLSVVVKG